MQNQRVVQDSKQVSASVIEIEKKSVYILGIFTTGEYDRFEGSIFDQLRISLYSEARYKYPEYELTNVSQKESYRFFKTTYSVKGQLVSKNQVKERLNLMSGALAQVPPSEADETPANISIPGEVEVDEAGVQDQDPDVDVASTVEVAEMLEEVIKQEYPEIAESFAIVQESKIEEDASSTSGEEAPIVVENAKDVEKVQPASPPTSRKDFREESELNVSPLVGKTVYIVACFKRQGFVEEKVELTQVEVGFPLAYYKTDKWIRVYLDGDFNNVIEAKEIFDDAWPIQYGR